jgi:hypothetical protein
VHFGEEGNKTFVSADLIKEVVGMVKNPTLIECSVLYRSPRSKARTHKELAIKHGFDFAPIDILDGEDGDDSVEINIKGKHFASCYLGQGLSKYRSILALAHFKGHMGTGFGGVLKTLGMGLGSRRGKLAMHSSIQHQVTEEKCISCGTCIEHCPVNAISYNKRGKANINGKVCISCSKCISVCPEQAIEIPWEAHGTQMLQERIAEYVLAALKDRPGFFVNILVNITDNCDCMGEVMKPLTNDIGILVSNDPVAVDQAAYDLVLKQFPGFKEFNGDHQLKHAERLGLGIRQYNLINL